MASRWFVRGGGKVYGPLDDARLRRLVAEGKINEATDISAQASGPWHPAVRVKGLFGSATPPLPRSAPPIEVLATAPATTPPARADLDDETITTAGHRRQCPACAKLCDARARWCPHCGCRFSSLVVWLTAAAAIGAVCIVAAGVGVYWSLCIQDQQRQTAHQREMEQRQQLRQELRKQREVVLQALADLSRQIAVSQRNVTDAIDAAVPGMMDLDFEVASVAKEIDQSRLRIEGAFGDEAGGRLSLEQVGELLADESGRVGPMKDRAKKLGDLAQNATTERTVDPQRLFPAILARAQQNLIDAGSPTGLIARRIRELKARRQEILDTVQAKPDCLDTRRKADEELAAIDKESECVEAASLAVKAFAPSFDAALKESRANVRQAMQRVDDARRKTVVPLAGEFGEMDRRDLQRAEEDLRELQDACARVEDEIAKALIRIEEESLQDQMNLLQRQAR